MSIKIYAEMDRMGSVTAYPVSDRWTKRFAKRAAENGGPSHETVYFQGDDADEFVREYVPRSKRRDIQEGYGVTFLADPWIVGHWFGYDAHTVTENRS